MKDDTRTSHFRLDTFEESWAYTVRFVERLPGRNPGWIPWAQFLLPLLRHCVELGLDHYFRAGQSVTDIIISTAESHGLEKYTRPLPRITIRFDWDRGQLIIAWSYPGLVAAPPDHVNVVESETAFPVLRSYLVDLWMETHPEVQIPTS